MIVKAVNAHDGLLAENARLRAELAEAVELLHRMIRDFHPFTSKPMGGWGARDGSSTPAF